MPTLYSLLRVLHVGAACLSVVVLLPPLLASKGSRLHVRSGWAWVAAMGVVIVTGTILALWMIVAPAGLRPGESSEGVRIGGLFLLLVAVLSASSIAQGLRAIARKHDRGPSRKLVDLGLPGLLGGLALIVLALGIGRRSALLAVFGAGSLALARQQLRFAWRPLESKMAFWYGHMSGMLGAVIATATAFSVAGLRRVVAVPEDLAILPWVAPALLLSPAFTLWTNYYRRRFGDRPAHDRTAVPAKP